MNLVLDQVTWSVAAKNIVEEISFNVETGACVGLLGPNGSGKSSLLKTIYRVHKPDAGMIELAGNDVWRLSVKELAQQNAVVAQENPAEFDFKVIDMVLMGRLPHKALFDRDLSTGQKF